MSLHVGARDSIQFGIWVGFAAIFVDAAVLHGIWWQNDPYWTYWITKTFLITTVFSLGTALLGIGLTQGLVLTGLHSVVLEVYYSWFAPVGLPQEPMWLPIVGYRGLWVAGLATHFLAILAGYGIVWWIWRRNQLRPATGDAASPVALFALGASVVVLVVDGILTQGILLQRFPGLTFFLQRLLVTFVFLFAWSAYVGYDRSGLVGGAGLLALVWTTYSMYLGPTGLPTAPPRYLGYEDLWLRSFPGGLISAYVGLWLATRVLPLPPRVAAAGM